MSLALVLRIAIAVTASVPAQPSRGPDSDGDGIADADEDTNHNGVVDPGETDPKRIDTDEDNVPDDEEREMGSNPGDPTDVPPIPEPLLVDLIRNLGSPRGELEVNVLASTSFRRRPGIQWAPEVEYVPLAGFGIELEVPMTDAEVHAVKAGAQATVGSLAARRVDFGVLSTHETHVHTPSSSTVVAAVVGVRFSSRVHGLTIVGPTVDLARGRRPTPGGLLSPSVFLQASRFVTFGVELGYSAVAGERSSQLVLPQVHVSPNPHVKLQVGMGGTHERESVVRPFSAVRLSWEY